MLSHLLQPEIRALIDERDLSTLKEILSDWTPTDIADLITNLPAENEQVIIFRLLPQDLATDTFEYLDFDMQMALIKAMGKEEVASILNEMSADDRTALLEELPSLAAKQMIMMLSPEERKIATSLLGYPENSVGRLMTPDYIAVKPEWTIDQTLEHIRKYGKHSETLNVIYVIDEKGRLIDDLKIRDIILAPLESVIADLMDENYVKLNVHDDQEKAVEVFKKYDRVALPVVDAFEFLIGIVTVDDVLDVAEEEATEDIHKLGGTEALEEPYIDTTISDMVKKRGRWLVVLFIGEMLTASAMGFFEDQISKAVILTLFVPLIISSGGNSGSQAATLVIRAMSLGEIALTDWWRVMKREIISGLLLGLILGLVAFLRTIVWTFFIESLGPHWIFIGLTVSFSLIGVVLWGTLSGSMLPFILKKLGADPATSSAPFVATLVDVIGIIIYFGFAIFLLTGKLL
ncbi:MAG: magnesium transporter [Ignavibacteriaceae bacterium]|nr:magnesium transporter [Ignavibacteriaceae bacterium]